GIGLRPRGRAARTAALPGAQLSVDVRKTYKLYVGGEFVRSESGRAYRPDGSVNVPRGSRKDLRDAVRAARSAVGGWSARTAMNRGQILYRAAEMLDGRRSQFVDVLGGVPGGVVSGLAGYRKELLSWLAAHMDVNASDVAGCTPAEVASIEKAAADSVKRVVKRPADEMSPHLITAFMEMKTVWHPIGV